MARFTAATSVSEMERKLRPLEEEYEMTPRREEEEEEGLFGPRGFFGNIRDYYKMDTWGDWWRGLLGREGRGREGRGGREREQYTVYPEWGKENIRNLRDIMRER
jgi:hypothetical protein